MRIIGIDPGNATTGYGVVDQGSSLRSVAAGTIRAKGLVRGPRRLGALHAAVLNVIDSYHPDVMSLERSFVAMNVQSAFALGEARAVAMLAAAHRGLEVFEYTPTDVKLSVAGYGRADKSQVKAMVRRTLALDATDELRDDAADALAIALCHLFRAKMPWPGSSRRGRTLANLMRGVRPSRVSL
ncbi:MAG TPA: crossover junction endodeoxyribonuclease RuvC [Candidatus Binataceae bacterium]|nr:crossover junction endodeoxyribonuclease RuvC [Candidatus Binataceae bacterium]